LRRGVLIGGLAGLLAVLSVFMVILDRWLAGDLLDDLTSSLVNHARAVRRALPPGDGLPLLESTVALSRELGNRITVIRSDGVVLADSERNPSVIENHAERPEVRQAMTGVIGVASRQSETVDRPLRYVALPPENGRIVRVADSMENISSRLRQARTLVGITGLLALAIGIVGVLVSVHHLKRGRPSRRSKRSPPAPDEPRNASDEQAVRMR
jgi:two-component system phosphate regulon sensor histidine kinase PhoR